MDFNNILLSTRAHRKIMIDEVFLDMCENWNAAILLKGNNLHDTEKPVELMKILVENSSQEKEIVLDPFIGIGTTAIACINTNRNYIGFEIDPDYYEAAQERMRIHMQQTIFELL